MSKSNPSSLPQTKTGASFRDPAGFIFKDAKNNVLRQINKAGQADFDLLMSSGLYEELTKNKILVEHKKLGLNQAHDNNAYAVIKPTQLPFTTYPFEWSFSQLKDAALLTLKAQKTALKFGMTLKDASAYNVQFHQGAPVMIDTLSFEKYQPGKPWQAYRQFCQHFLAPLALMSYTDINLSQLSRVHLDGVPLDQASRLLPAKAKLRPGIAMHVVVHGRAQKAKAYDHKRPAANVSMLGLVGILDSLARTINSLKLPKVSTEWGDYYDKTNYTASSADQKAKLIKQFVQPLNAKTAVDLGGNNGRFCRVLNKLNIETVCTDIDPNAVEANYVYTKTHKETAMLPMVVDLTNPGGGLGWANDERPALHNRVNVDVVMALAIVHHLAISNNLPLDRIAEYFATLGKYLVIEFVPKDDSQVMRLLSTRDDIFPDYTEDGLKKAFAGHYKLVKESKIKGSKRTLYLFKRK